MSFRISAALAVLAAALIAQTAGPTTASVQLRKLRRIVRATGTIQPVDAVIIPVPPVQANLVLTAIVASGTIVKPGDPVAEFDRTSEMDKARDAKAKFEDLSHQVEQKRAQNRADAEKRASDLQQAEADLGKAAIELRKGPLLSEIDRSKAQSKLDTAKAHVESLHKSMALRDKAAAADLKILELQAERQKIAMERAQNNADKLLVLAPLAGMVSQEVVWRGDGPGHPREGDQLWPGQPLVRIFSQTQMEVQASVAEPDGAILAPGSQGTVRLDAYPGLEFKAHFESASPVATGQPDTTVRTFSARYRLESTDPRLLPDLAAAMDIELAGPNPVPSIPRNAVVRRLGKTYVMRVAGGSVKEQPVTLGNYDDQFVEIVQGLAAGDRVQLPPSGISVEARR